MIFLPPSFFFVPIYENRKIGSGKSESCKIGKSENEKSEIRKFGISEIQKIGYSENRKVGNLENRTFGKSGIWNIGNSENTSLARAVASLARTGNTCKYFGTLKSRSPEIQYFGSLVNRKFGNSKHRKIGKH